MVFTAHAILNGVEPLATHRRLGAVGKVAACIQAHAQNGVAGLGERQHHGAIGLRAGMRLHVGVGSAEKLLGAVDGQLFHDIRGMAALIVTLAGITFGIFVGEHRSLGFQHGAGNDVLRRDQFDLVLLAVKLGGNRSGHSRITYRSRRFEEAIGADFRNGTGAHSASPQPNLATRPAWRPPSNGVFRNSATQSRAVSMPIIRLPSAMQLASLC